MPDVAAVFRFVIRRHIIIIMSYVKFGKEIGQSFALLTPGKISDTLLFYRNMVINNTFKKYWQCTNTARKNTIFLK